MRKKQWREWMITVILTLILLMFVLSGCAWRGVMGDGCVLCDLVPPSGDPARSQTFATPVTAVAPAAVRFNGTAVVSLDGTLYPLRGEIFQTLQSVCGITYAEAKDRYGWSTAVAHDYGVEMWASTSWDASIGTVRVSVMVSRNTFVNPQRRDYVFVKNGSGAATYGESYGASGVRRIGMYRNADAALRVATSAAIANLCGGSVLYRPRADAGDAPPQEISAPCASSDGCYEQTISISGTWGGPGIYSHWPPRTIQQDKHHHHHNRGFTPRGGRRGK